MEDYDNEKIYRVRHGGRTFKIGQTDKYDANTNKFGLWDGQETSASRNWVAWRLTDVFSNKFPTEDTNKDGSIDSKDGFTGYDRYQTEGLININGVLRDGGMALRTVISGLKFTENATGLSGKTIIDNFLEELIFSVRDHLTNNSPSNPSNYRLFWERGQLSELTYRDGANWSPIFSTGNKLGANMENVYDRAKEELFKRTVELICSKGNTFTVYVVGQTLSPFSGKVLATSRKKQIFRVVPDYEISNPGGVPYILPNDEDFDPSIINTSPTSPASVRAQDRFRRPTRYMTLDLLQYNE
jgi:hypothetical protein